MAGALVTFTIASGEATIITPQPVVTDANGDAIIFLTSTKPGFVTITAVADGKTIVNGSPVKIRFTEKMFGCQKYSPQMVMEQMILFARS